MTETRIPRTLPTREEIAELALKDITVAMAIGQFRAGKIGYEDALRIAVVGLATIVDRAMAELMKQAQSDGSQKVVYLYPPTCDIDQQPQCRLDRRQLAGVLLAAFAAGLLIGLVFAGLGPPAIGS